MSGFIDRAVRFRCVLPVRFYSAEGLETGYSVDVSASGTLVTFDRAVEVWLTGDLAVQLPTELLHIPVRVARVAGNEAGLSFRLVTGPDRAAVDALLAFAESQGATPKP